MPEESLILRMREVGAAQTAAAVDAVAASVGRLSTASATASKRIIRMGRSTRYTGRELTHGLTLPIVAVGGAAVYMAAKWEQSMTAVATQTRYTQGQVSGLQDQVLEMARGFPQGPEAFAEAFLHLAKVGVPANKILGDLKVSAKAATIAQSDLSDTSSAAAAAWLVGIKGGTDFNTVMHDMVATIGTGNLSMQQLTTSMGTGVVPMAKLAGLSLKDVLAVIALATDEGMKASSATAQLGTALHFLYKPSDKAEKALAGIGLSGEQLAQTMHKPRGLLRVMSLLKSSLDKLPGGLHGVAAEQVLGDIFPASRGKVLQVLLNQTDRYKNKLNQLNQVQGKFGASYQKAKDTPLNKLHTAISNIKVDFIHIGADILPSVAVLFGKIANAVHDVAKWFHGLSPHTQKLVIIFLGLLAVLGPLLSIIGLMVIAVGALASPVALIAIGLVALVADIIIAYHRFKWFRDIVDAVWWTFKNLTPLGLVITHFSTIKDFLTSLPSDIKTAWEDALNFVIGMINHLIHGVDKLIGGINAVNPFADIPTIGDVGYVGTKGQLQNLAKQARGGPALTPAPPLTAPMGTRGLRDMPRLTPVPVEGAHARDITIPLTVMLDGEILYRKNVKAAKRLKSKR